MRVKASAFRLPHLPEEWVCEAIRMLAHEHKLPNMRYRLRALIR